MPTPQSKKPTEKDFLKRRSLDDGIELTDMAHLATWRLYCETLRFWRTCKTQKCRRHRRCLGQPAPCLMNGLPGVPHEQRLAAATAVVAGGPRRLPPATHMEWLVRRQPLPTLTSWRGLSKGGPATSPSPGGRG
jgi:hypothetical protein